MACTVFLIVYIFPRETQFGFEYQKNTPWLHEDLIAPFDYSIRKSKEQIDAEKKAILENTLEIFTRDHVIEQTALQAANEKFVQDWPTFFSDQFGTDKAVKQSTRFKDEQEIREHYLAQLQSVIKQVFEKGIIENHELPSEDQKVPTIVVINKKVENEYEVTRFHTLQSSYEFANKAFATIENEEGKAFLESIVLNLLQPNILRDETAKEKLIAIQISSISTSYGKVSEGERIIERGEIVSESAFKKLKSLEASYEEQVGGATNWKYVLFGQILLVSIAVVVVFFFLSIFRKDVITGTKKLIFIFFVFTLNTYMASIAQYIDFIHIFTLPFVLMPVAIRTFFDNRLAAFVHVISIVLIGFFAPNPFEFVFIQTMTGLVALFSLAGLRKRSQLLFTVVVVFLASSITYLGFSAIQEGNLSSIKWNNIANFAFASGLTLFIYPLIFLLEKLFGFLSDVTLMEISDTNAPLLRNLASKAPGTFQHSMQVANLAEEAAVKVGADPLLIRTGALYHDIGKMKAPAFFIENQMGTTNLHDDLPHPESAKIIINHVIHGIELAKKANLPEPIIDFIRTHHGTTVTRYFYYLQLKKDPNTKKEDFQYPGPLPFSKETAILMMADSVEAAARSLKEHNSESISKLVDSIINNQAKEEQFANADITFKDLSTLKKLFKKRLMSIYHVRVEYPK